MNDILYYILTPIDGALVGETRRFQAQVQVNGNVDEETFISLTAKYANRNEESVAYVLRCADATQQRLHREGYAVTRGGTYYKPVCQGSFPQIDSGFDPVRNKMAIVGITRDPLRGCLANVTAKNMVSPPMPVIQQIADLVTGEQWVLTSGNACQIAGRQLAPDASAEGEGVKLVSLTTGEAVATGTITKSDLQIVHFTIATWPAPGTYRLELSTRSGLGEDFTLTTVSRNVTVVPGEEEE